MRILHVAHSYWPVVGGIESAIKAIAEEQARLGHDVHVLTSYQGVKGRPKEEPLNGVYIHRIKALRFSYPDLTYPIEIPEYEIKKFDIIQVYSQNSLFSYVITKTVKKLGKRVAFYFLGVDYLRNHYNPVIRLIGYKYETYITRKITELVDQAFTLNKCERELLRGRYGITAEVIPHGISEEFISAPIMSQSFRDKYGIDGEIISYIGRLHPTKGVDMLIRAFSIVHKKYDVKLVIAGNGSINYINYLKSIAERLGVDKNTYFIGYVSDTDKIGLIDASKSLVLPTRHAGESYPLIINEAAARDKPIIINKVGCAWSIGLENIVVSEPSVEALAKTITHVVNDDSLPSKLSGLRWRIPTWRQVSELLIKHYERVI